MRQLLGGAALFKITDLRERKCHWINLFGNPIFTCIVTSSSVPTAPTCTLIFLICRFGRPPDDALLAGLFVVTGATGLFVVAGADFSFKQKFDFIASLAVNL